MRLFLICTAVFVLNAFSAQANTPSDSLLLRLESLPHNEERLQILDRIVTLTQGDMETCRRYNQQLFEEADIQNNDYYRCMYYLTELTFAYNSLDNKRVYEVADTLMPLARKMKLYHMLFRAWRCKIDYMIFSHDFERNEREAKRMLAEAQKLDSDIGILEAYQCLANVYSATYRKADAIAILEQALPVARKIDKIADLSNVWQPLMFLYSSSEEYAKWLAVLNEANTYIDNLPAEQARLEDLFRLILYSSYVEYYTATDNLVRAEYYLHRAEALQNETNSPLYIIFFNKSIASFYEHSQDYEKALECIDIAIKQLQSIATGEDYFDILPIKARILNKMGRYDDAIGHLKNSIAYKDSLQVLSINKQYEQLKQSFNADLLLIEKTELQNRQQIYTLWLLGMGLAMIGGFVVYLMRSQRTLRKAESEMRDMNRQIEQVNEAKNRFLSNISNTIRGPLNTVVEGSLALAERQIQDSEGQQQLSASIRQMSGSLLTMINDLLDLSRLEAGMMKFDVRDVEISSMLLDAVYAAQTPGNKITLRTEYPENTLFMVHLDGGRLMQVFKSLFAADSGEVEVVVNEKSRMFQLRVTGSQLAGAEANQEVIIHNEINRMLIVHFGGSYTIDGQVIRMEIPVTEEIRITE